MIPDSGDERMRPPWVQKGILQKYRVKIASWRIRLRFLLYGELAVGHLTWVDTVPTRAESVLWLEFPGAFPAVASQHLPNLADLEAFRDSPATRKGKS